MDKSVYIILVNYNGTQDTLECVESIRKSDYDNIHTIIVDNNSKDIEVLKSKLDQEDDITIISLNENLGFAKANNVGIEEALNNKANYVLLLNNDTVIENTLISKLVMNSQSHGDCVCVPKMYYFSEKNRIWYGGGEINKFTGNAKHSYMNELDNENMKLSYVTFATGCCMLIPHNVINKVGMLSTEYFMYCEDTDYCIKILSNNVQILFVPDAHLWHKVSKSTGGDLSPFTNYYITRNRLLYVKKFKKYFYFSAYYFSYITRVIRKLQAMVKHNDDLYRAFKYGIKDYKDGITGKYRY